MSEDSNSELTASELMGRLTITSQSHGKETKNDMESENESIANQPPDDVSPSALSTVVQDFHKDLLKSNSHCLLCGYRAPHVNLMKFHIRSHASYFTLVTPSYLKMALDANLHKLPSHMRKRSKCRFSYANMKQSK